MSDELKRGVPLDGFSRTVVGLVLVALAWWLAVVADRMAMDGSPGRLRGLVVAAVALFVAWRVWRLIEAPWARVALTMLAGLPALVVGAAHLVDLFMDVPA